MATRFEGWHLSDSSPIEDIASTYRDAKAKGRKPTALHVLKAPDGTVINAFFAPEDFDPRHPFAGYEDS